MAHLCLQVEVLDQGVGSFRPSFLLGGAVCLFTHIYTYAHRCTYTCSQAVTYDTESVDSDLVTSRPKLLTQAMAELPRGVNTR